MDKFLSVPSFWINLSGLNLNPLKDRKVFWQSLILFFMQTVILIVFNVTSCVALLTDHVDIDKAFSVLNIVLLTSVVLVKYFAIYQKRSEVQKVIKSLQKINDPGKLKKFETFKKLLIGYTSIALMLYILAQISKLFKGITPISGFSSKSIDNIFLSILIFSLGLCGQVFGMLINVVTETLFCKMSFLISLEFEEIASKLKELKSKNERESHERIFERFKRSKLRTKFRTMVKLT